MALAPGCVGRIGAGLHLAWGRGARHAGAMPRTAFAAPLNAPQHLADRQVRRLVLQPGDVVQVRSGVLWLTQVGDAADHLLPAGSVWRSPLKRPIVIQAVSGPASWALQPQPSPRQRP